MSPHPVSQPPWPSLPVLFTLLPGPDRGRADCTYRYRLTYRSADGAGPGCAMTWEVSGGRHSYQIAIERDEKGELHPHCTCADAVYRAEEEGRYCKHVLGLLAFGSPGHALVEVRPEPVTLRIWTGPVEPAVPVTLMSLPLNEVA